MGKMRAAITRRGFLAAAGASLVPARLRAGSPNDRLNLAFIGAGGRGGANLKGLAEGNNVVALCDVDETRAAAAFRGFPGARKYRDHRRMLEEIGKGLDAVVISTPDHAHAVQALAAIRMGLHVYCEKPLAHSVREIRALMKAAREKGVVTQLGNQGHSTESIRKCVEWVRAGAIGRVREVHASCSAMHWKVRELPLLEQEHPVPKDLDWDLWLGPAPFRRYHPVYLPGKWRGWKAFGSGTIGDWVCHVVDPSFWALELGAPRSVEALRLVDYDPAKHAETFPRGATIRFEFPARGERGPVTLFWYSADDATRKPRPEGVPESYDLPATGAVLLGDRGSIVHGSHGASGVKLAPDEKMKAFTPPAPTLPRVEGGNHYTDFVAAIKNKRKAGSDFAEYGGPLTEIAALGIISMNFPGRTLSWDAEAVRFTDCDEANRFLAPPMREGWSL